MTPSIPELAWAAGIIDGEGCIHLHKKVNKSHNTSYSLVVAIQMTHKPTINRLRMIFGCGGDYTQKRKENKPLHRVRWGGIEAFQVLQLTLPYLYTKKYEAELGIEFWEKCYNHKQPNAKIEPEIQTLRDVIYEELREAKQ